MHLTPEQLLERLAAEGYQTTTTRHPPLHTVEMSRQLRGDIPGRHTKNLFLKDRKDNYFLVTTGEDSILDLKRLHTLIGAASRLSFGSAERMMEFLGVTPGSVTALAVVNDRAGRVQAILDEELMSHALINAHPLTNEATTTMRREDLIAFMTAAGHPPRILPVSRPDFPVPAGANCAMTAS